MGVLLLLLVSISVADDTADSYRQFAFKQDPGLATGRIRARGFLEMDFHRRTRWYMEVLANSRTARSGANLTIEQCHAAAKIADSLKVDRLENLKTPTALDSESLKFLQPQQRRWLVSLIVWTEGLVALRHPLVCDALGVDGECRKMVWKRVQRDADVAQGHWAKIFGLGFFMTTNADAEKAATAIFEMTFAFEAELWSKDLAENNCRALLNLPVFAPELARQITKETNFLALMALGEQAGDDPPKTYDDFRKAHHLGEVGTYGLGNLHAAGTTAHFLQALPRDESSRKRLGVASQEADKLARIANKGSVEIVGDSGLTAELLDGLSIKQHETLAGIAFASEGLYALRHPFVRYVIGVDAAQTKLFLRRLETPLKRARELSVDYVSGGPSRRVISQAERVDLQALSKKFELEVWDRVLGQHQREALIRLGASPSSAAPSK